jgi:peptidoglycan/xylan/chitin deacetylase (PgdA/CDA1 family)
MLKNKTTFIKKILVSFLIVAGVVSLLRQFYWKDFSTANRLELSTPKLKEGQILATSSTPLNVNEVASISARQKLGTQITDDFVVEVPVLTYHYIRDAVPPSEELSYHLSVKVADLESQFSYLAQSGFHTLSLGDLYESLVNRTPLPPKSVIITFDDGFRDFYFNAFPLVKKYNLRVVSFYVVGYTNYPNYMSWSMLKELHNSGLVDIQSHTMSHFLLTGLSPEHAKSEIFESKRILEEMLGKKVSYIAYPYGDYNEEIVNMVREAGYRLAFSTRPGSELRSGEQFFLRRMNVSGFDTLETFKAKLTQ